MALVVTVYVSVFSPVLVLFCLGHVWILDCVISVLLWWFLAVVLDVLWSWLCYSVRYSIAIMAFKFISIHSC